MSLTQSKEEFIDGQDLNDIQVEINHDPIFSDDVDHTKRTIHLIISDEEESDDDDIPVLNDGINHTIHPIISVEGFSLQIPDEEDIVKRQNSYDTQVECDYDPILDDSGNFIMYNPETDIMEIIKIDDNVFGQGEYANCDWNQNSRKFINPYLSQDERRRKRLPLTEIADENVIFLFLRSLLFTALENEWNTEGDESFYVYHPYNPRSYLNLSMDDFSEKSFSKKIGIRSKLDIQSVNIILSCFYVLYSRFKKTSDEIIFEETYRECVLMQDSSFELAKYYDRVSTEHPEKICTLSSLMSQCLDLVPFPDRKLQFDVWKLTYSGHSKKVVINESSDTSGFLTIEELLSKYDEEWFVEHQSGQLDIPLIKIDTPSTIDTKMVATESLDVKPDDELEISPLLDEMNISTAPSTPVVVKKSSGFGFIDSLISRMTFSFGGKSKTA